MGRGLVQACGRTVINGRRGSWQGGRPRCHILALLCESIQMTSGEGFTTSGDADEDPRLHTHTAVQYRPTTAALQALNPHLTPSAFISFGFRF